MMKMMMIRCGASPGHPPYADIHFTLDKDAIYEYFCLNVSWLLIVRLRIRFIGALVVQAQS